MITNNKGFSLIELMVVVAIIAILSTIAIPSYQGFQARARQKEGFALLSAYYTSAQGTYAEHGVFPGNFVQTGFAPTGQLTYRVTAADGPNLDYGSNDNACIDTSAACNCGGTCASFKVWDEKTLGAVGTSKGPRPVGTAGACGTAPNNVGALGVTANNFSIRVSGVIRNTAALQDEYGMNERKILAMCTDGLN